MDDNDLLKALPYFATAMAGQLLEDQERWGDTYRRRDREGQERRIFDRYAAYYDQFINGGTPIPWLKIACLALIGWWRDELQHPEANGHD